MADADATTHIPSLYPRVRGYYLQIEEWRNADATTLFTDPALEWRPDQEVRSRGPRRCGDLTQRSDAEVLTIQRSICSTLIVVKVCRSVGARCGAVEDPPSCCATTVAIMVAMRVVVITDLAVSDQKDC